MRWALPENVTSVITMPLWGPAPARRTTRTQAQSVLRPLGELVDVLLSPPGEAQDRFGNALRELFEFAQQRT